VVVKYADNVLKGFATSISILISSVVSWYLFHDLDVNMGFLFGSGIVLTAVYTYGYTPPAAGVGKQLLLSKNPSFSKHDDDDDDVDDKEAQGVRTL
jgi:hypothetical protein